MRPFVAPLVLTVWIVVGAALGPSALASPASGSTPLGVGLDGGWLYVALAPLTTVLDALSLLTLAQHYAVLATLIVAFVAWRVLRSRQRLGWLRRAGLEVAVAALCLLGLLSFYGYGIVGPRPMAALVVDDPDVVVVDVHSHTHHSHDGRDGFDAEDNREWHASAGFDAVYVSDHRTYQGYADGAPRNPSRAGEGTVLLPGLEIKFAGKYASVLGPAWRYRGAMDGNHLLEDSLYAALRRGAPRPTLVLTIPGGLDDVPASTADSIGYVAIEISDASPRGLQQGRRDRALLYRMADSLNLAPVAASNNHGWGRTAAAWTLLRIPGWRTMTPARLGAAIEDRFHRGRRDASWVVERRVPYHGESPIVLASTVPTVAWQLFGGLTPAERGAWLVWTWALVFLVALPLRRLREVRHAA